MRRVLAGLAVAGLALWGAFGAVEIAAVLARAALEGWFGPVAMAVGRAVGQ